MNRGVMELWISDINCRCHVYEGPYRDLLKQHVELAQHFISLGYSIRRERGVFYAHCLTRAPYTCKLIPKPIKLPQPLANMSRTEVAEIINAKSRVPRLEKLRKIKRWIGKDWPANWIHEGEELLIETMIEAWEEYAEEKVAKREWRYKYNEGWY